MNAGIALRLRRYATVAVLAVCLLTSSATSLSAQTRNDTETGIRAFLRTTGETIYGFAWPTATYREMSLAGIQPVPGGFDVIVKLSGESAFGGELWVKLGLIFRDGLRDVRVLSHNAQLIPPFATAMLVGQLAQDLAKEYANRQAAEEADAVCLSNPTGETIRFSYRWGNNEWKTYVLEANQEGWFWWGQGSTAAPGFFVRYDDSFEEGFTEQVYRLEMSRVTLPTTCASARKYVFGVSGQKIELRSQRI